MQRVVTARFRAPERINVCAGVAQRPQIQMREKKRGRALHLAGANQRISAPFAASHHQKRAMTASLNTGGAEERGDVSFVIGMGSDPENALRRRMARRVLPAQHQQENCDLEHVL